MNTSHELRVFISSTFRDLQEEREHLVKKIFPEIRALCRERGITFTEVDLRWGLTEEEGMLGRIIRTCLEEIDRCRPYFFGITGERYGYVPDYLDVQKDPELLARYPWVEQAALEGVSIIDMEFHHAVLRRADDVAGARFFFRRQRERLERPGALDRWSRAESAEDDTRLEELKLWVRSTGLPVEEFRDPVSLGEIIYDELVAIIRRDFADARPPTELEQERSKHEGFAASRRHAYIANPAYVQRLNAFAASEGPPLVLYAESGSGKSSLVAHWSQQYRQMHPEAFIVEHYVGIGAGDSDHLGIIRHLMAEIKDRFSRSEQMPSKPEELEHAFANWLGFVGKYTGDSSPAEPPASMIIILDGLNQLRGRALSMSWLPEYIPANIRLILTTTVEQTLVALRGRGWSELGMQPLSRKERESVVVRFLSEFHKALSAELVGRIAEDAKCAHPLFLRTLLEELRLIGSYERLDRMITRYLETTGTEDLFQRVLERMESDFSTREVRQVMSLLWGARTGLTELELAELTGLSRMKISTLLLGLDYHLVRRDGLLGFFHDYLRRAVEKRYLSEEGRTLRVYEDLAAYFEQTPAGERGTLELLHALESSRAKSERVLAVLRSWPRLMPLLNGESRYELLRQCAQLSQREDCSREAVERALHAAAAPEGVGDTDELEVLQRMAALLEQLGYWATAVELAERRRELAEQRDDRSAVAGALATLGRVENMRWETDVAQHHLQQAIAAFEELGERKALSDAVGALGVMFTNRGEYDRALECFRKQEEICRALGDRNGLAGMIINLGTLYFYLRRYDEALERYREGEEISREIGNRHWLSNAIGNMGTVHRMLGEYDQALECYRQAEVIARELGNRLSLSITIGSIGIVFENRGEFDRALEYYRQQEEISREIGYRRGEGLAIGNIGNVHYERGELDRALECWRRDEDICRELGDRIGESRAASRIGLMFARRGEFEQALECFRRQEEISSELADRKDLSNAIGNSGLVYGVRGEYERALDCFGRAIEGHRAIGYRRDLTTWLAGTARVLLDLVASADGAPAGEIGMPGYLPRYVSGATEDSWRTLSIRTARAAAEECVALSEELSKPETLFIGRTLLGRADAAEGDGAIARQRLERMLGDAGDDAKRAELYYWLWKLAASRDAAERAAAKDCRSEALRLFTSLIGTSPQHEFLMRIDDLDADRKTREASDVPE